MDMTDLDLAAFLIAALGVPYYLVTLALLAVSDALHTPKSWPLAATVVTYALAPAAMPLALLIALPIRLALPTANEDADDGRVWI